MFPEISKILQFNQTESGTGDQIKYPAWFFLLKIILLPIIWFEWFTFFVLYMVLLDTYGTGGSGMLFLYLLIVLVVLVYLLIYRVHAYLSGGISLHDKIKRIVVTLVGSVFLVTVIASFIEF